MITDPAKLVLGGLGPGLSRALGSRAGAAFGILTYHRITPWAGPEPAPTWNVTPAHFRAQLQGLLERGYRPLPLGHALDRSRAGRPLPRKAFVVTFDDGYENFALYALPVLRDLGVHATVFLATAYLDRQVPFPFDDWPAAGAAHVPPEAWRPLSSAQCAGLLGDGLVELGTHTHTHAVFRGRPEALVKDLRTSLKLLRERFGLAEVPFSFPFGICGPELTAAARQAGVRCSLTTDRALVRPGSDPFTWGRFGVGDADTPATLVTRLDGWYNLARSAWALLRRLLPGEARR